MNIRPVAGTPTLPQSSNTGVSPEKLARLKAIAAGDSQINVTPVEEEKEERAPALKRITMRTNQTVNRNGDAPTPKAGAAFDKVGAAFDHEESAISDDSVQANETAEVTQPLSPQLAAIQKQRRALQVKERELADREKAINERASDKGPTRAELEGRIKSNALGVLQEYGVTYDQLTEQILAANNGVNPEIQALKAELAAMKEDVTKTLSDKDAATEQAVLTEIGRNVHRLCAQGDDFELIRETASQSDVVDLIHRTWKDTGEVLDEQEAAKLVEEDLATEALKIAQLKKVQGKLTPQVPLQPQPAPMRTLTNKDSASPSMSRRQRAIQAALGNLKR